MSIGYIKGIYIRVGIFILNGIVLENMSNLFYSKILWNYWIHFVLLYYWIFSRIYDDIFRFCVVLHISSIFPTAHSNTNTKLINILWISTFFIVRHLIAGTFSALGWNVMRFDGLKFYSRRAIKKESLDIQPIDIVDEEFLIFWLGRF